MTSRIFRMTEQVMKSRKTKGSRENCHTCGTKIKVGDSVVTKIGICKGGRPIRHEACARSVNVI